MNWNIEKLEEERILLVRRVELAKHFIRNPLTISTIPTYFPGSKTLYILN